MNISISLIRQRSMQRSGQLVAVAMLTLSLAACSPGDANTDPALGWLPAGSPKTLDVDRAQYRHVVYFDTDRDELRADEQDRLIAFLDAVQPTSDDNVRIDGHADERASDLYNLDLAGRRIDAVRRFLGEIGFSGLAVQASSFGERVPADAGDHSGAWSKNRRVELVFERYMVTPPACPDWSRHSGTDFANQPHTNFGCATEANLGLMIANPRDLVRGRKLGPADGIHQAEGILRYRKGQLTELNEERVE